MLADSFLKFFTNHVTQHGNKKYLLAVSGGMDSMAMLHLFHSHHFNIVVAHCNFHLRGEESDEDEAFVMNVCLKKGIPFYLKHFDMEKQKSIQNEGTQLVARNLRYEWFETLRSDLGFDFICTAHHQQDNIETILQRFMQGAYPESLQGIKPINGHLLRPLIFTEHKKIIALVKQEHISFRLDRSNLKQDYTRNKIRQAILPALHDVFGDGYQSNIEKAGSHYQAYFQFIQQQSQQLMLPVRQWHEINIEQLSKLKGNHALLYETLKHYGFNWSQCQDICHDLNREAGTCFENNERTYFLFFARDVLQLVPQVKAKPEHFFILPQDFENHSIDLPGHPLFMQLKNKAEPHHYLPGVLYFDLGLIQPQGLLVRSWQPGDTFTPLGMRGTKSVADFLKDLGLTPAEKQNCLILCIDDKIIGIPGYRIDDAFKVTANTKRILEIGLGSQGN